MSDLSTKLAAAMAFDIEREKVRYKLKRHPNSRAHPSIQYDTRALKGVRLEVARRRPLDLALQKCVEALDIAQEILAVPERHQDNEWFTKSAQVDAALAELERVIGEMK